MKAKVTESEFNEYLQISYRLLAAVAWQCYQIDGKGVVFATIDNTIAIPGGNYPTYTAYIAENRLGELIAILAQQGVDELRKEVTEYEPSSAFVVLALFKSDMSNWIGHFPVKGEKLEDIFQKEFAYLDNHLIKSVDELGNDFLSKPSTRAQ